MLSNQLVACEEEEVMYLQKQEAEYGLLSDSTLVTKKQRYGFFTLICILFLLILTLFILFANIEENVTKKVSFFYRNTSID